MATVGPRCLVTLEEARDFLKLESTDDDALLVTYCDMVTALVERHTLRRLKSRTYDGQAGNEPVLMHNGSGRGEMLLREWPFTSISAVTAVTADGTTTRTVGIGGYRIIDGGRAVLLPADIFDKGQANIAVSGDAGYLAGPHDRELQALKAATLRWVQTLWQDRVLAVGRGANITVGGESLTFIDAPIPRDIAVMLAGFVRW